MITRYYKKNADRFSTIPYYCKDHGVIFHIRCYLCYRDDKQDPDRVFVDGKEDTKILDYIKNNL